MIFVAWAEPGAEGDYVAVVGSGFTGTEQNRFHASGFTGGDLLAPTTPGEYELHYVGGSTGETLDQIVITVTPSQVMFFSRTEVEAESVFPVNYSGPCSPGDLITIVPKGAPEGPGPSAFAADGSGPGDLSAPAEPGMYELRYLAGQDGSTLASRSIEVLAG
jgi:Ca-activated chloride channel family protein